MRSLWLAARLLINADRAALARGAALSVAVLLMGAALLGLSGWFIVATGVAGLAGVGVAFDVFRPSAGVRFLALGRTAARYGERILTHDATLRALAALRVDLLRRTSRQDGFALARARSTSALTRIIADVDALDGVLLRVILPSFAAAVTLGLVGLFLSWIMGWQVAMAILFGFGLTAGLCALALARATITPSREGEVAMQALRRGVIDLIRDREALILSGRLGQAEGKLLDIDAQARSHAAELDRADRLAGFALQMIAAITASVVFVLGSRAFFDGTISAAVGVVAFFAALALLETILPFRRGFGEIGRQMAAAGRIVGEETQTDKRAHNGVTPTDWSITVQSAAATFTLMPGAAMALTGASGSGKSTLLLQISGLLPTDTVQIGGVSPQNINETLLRDKMAVVPQRSALIAGTIRENLQLSGDHSYEDMMAALGAVDLERALESRGGLDLRLGEGGAGLSGGQAKRLTIARALLRHPQILLLDEPTEGLDGATADACLASIRRFLPEATIIAALHNQANHDIFTQRVHMCRT